MYSTKRLIKCFVPRPGLSADRLCCRGTKQRPRHLDGEPPNTRTLLDPFSGLFSFSRVKPLLGEGFYLVLVFQEPTRGRNRRFNCLLLHVQSSTSPDFWLGARPGDWFLCLHILNLRVSGIWTFLLGIYLFACRSSLLCLICKLLHFPFISQICWYLSFNVVSLYSLFLPSSRVTGSWGDPF